MEFKIRLAGKIIQISSKYEEIYELCKRYIIDDAISIAPDIVVETVDSDFEYENEMMLQADEKWKNETGHVYSPAYLETIIIYKKIANAMMAFDTLVIHGSVISTDGNAYMLTAPSGVGKTTRTMLWVDNIPNTIVVNGDKPLVHVSEEQITVYGTPWCGKEGWNNNVAIPLKAVFFIKRAENGEKDKVVKLDPGEAALRIYKQTYLANGFSAMNSIFHLLKIMSEKVEFYELISNPTVEAVRLAYDTVRNK